MQRKIAAGVENRLLTHASSLAAFKNVCEKIGYREMNGFTRRERSYEVCPPV